MRQIDRASRVPPSEQIANHLRAEIEAGRYSPDGPALPSVARLSQEWDVAPRTAHKALKALAAEGLIEVQDGMGFYLRRELQVCHN
jgi:DNA-binding GntR family transcriptional regulator